MTSICHVTYSVKLPFPDSWCFPPDLLLLLQQKITHRRPPRGLAHFILPKEISTKGGEKSCIRMADGAPRQSGLVSVIAWLIRPGESGRNNHVRPRPCFTRIMKHSFGLICCGNLVIFPSSWDGKRAVVIFLLWACVRGSGRANKEWPQLRLSPVSSEAAARSRKVRLVTS